MFPQSCDVFVVRPPVTACYTTVFGKNSDRPRNEVQEVIMVPGGVRGPKLKCTYITIDESPYPINSVILSKPAWMWGAEMGANDCNVVIGNVAVWTKYNEGKGDAREKRLLGMDLVRLGLERGRSAVTAMNVITSLLEEYGQGGPCSENDESLFYHNSFLIADYKEAWVLETSGELWAAEKVECDYRNISNALTITTKMDKTSRHLHEQAHVKGFWDGKEIFNFSKIFSSGGEVQRQDTGRLMLQDASAPREFDVQEMMAILKDKDSRICRGCDDTFPTQGSQVSVISELSLCVHWFTGTPDPSISFYKPFIFTENAQVSPHLVSPDEPPREHHLYKLHKERIINGKENDKIRTALEVLQEKRIRYVDEYTEKFDIDDKVISDLQNIMVESVDSEIELYNK